MFKRVAVTEVTALCKKQTSREDRIASDTNYFHRIQTARKFANASYCICKYKYIIPTDSKFCHQHIQQLTVYHKSFFRDFKQAKSLISSSQFRTVVTSESIVRIEVWLSILRNVRWHPAYIRLSSPSRNFSHIPKIKGNSRIRRRSIDFFTGEGPAWSINHKVLNFTGKCNESQFYCTKPKKSSTEEGSSSISTVDRRRCHLHLLHLCHGCTSVQRMSSSVPSRLLLIENFVPLGMLRI